MGKALRMAEGGTLPEFGFLGLSPGPVLQQARGAIQSAFLGSGNCSLTSVFSSLLSGFCSVCLFALSSSEKRCSLLFLVRQDLEVFLHRGQGLGLYFSAFKVSIHKADSILRSDCGCQELSEHGFPMLQEDSPAQETGSVCVCVWGDGAAECSQPGPSLPSCPADLLTGEGTCRLL